MTPEIWRRLLRNGRRWWLLTVVLTFVALAVIAIGATLLVDRLLLPLTPPSVGPSTWVTATLGIGLQLLQGDTSVLEWLLNLLGSPALLAIAGLSVAWLLAGQWPTVTLGVTNYLVVKNVTKGPSDPAARELRDNTTWAKLRQVRPTIRRDVAKRRRLLLLRGLIVGVVTGLELSGVIIAMSAMANWTQGSFWAGVLFVVTLLVAFGVHLLLQEVIDAFLGGEFGKEPRKT